MGAYAAVITLKHKIEHITDPTNYPGIIRDAYDNLQRLGDLLQQLDTERNRRFDIGAIKALDAEIKKVVWKLEDALDCCALRRSLPSSNYNGCPQLQTPLVNSLPSSNYDGGCPQMQIPLVDKEGEEQEIRSFINTIGELELEFNIQLKNLLEDEDEDEDEDEEVVSPKPDFGGSKQSTATIGIHNDSAEKIIKELLNDKPYFSPKSVTLVGMAGIGKTHLARDIYQHPLLAENFDITVWVRVGQKCRSVKKLLLQIVAQTEGKPISIYMDLDIYTLSFFLKNSLDDQRCLIILDDIWSETLCKKIMRMVEEAGVKKFLVTTRIREVNKDYGNIIHEMQLWDDEDSWNLLWRNVFPDKSSFPPHLERAGKKIAENCEGLPLLILTVADILSTEDKTEEYWNKVANKRTSTFTDAYEKISQVLASSYDYLPEHLKACFLYMGVFPQRSQIPVRKLTNLFSVEEFVEPLEFFIMECMKKLMSNSLVITCKHIDNDDKKVKLCKLHSAYWYLCIKEAGRNKFYHALNKLADGSEDYIQGQRRLSVQNNVLFGIKEVRDSMAAALTARSLLITGEYHPYPVPMCYNLMFLKVLDALAIRLYEFPKEVVKLLLLRYLSLTHNGKLPQSISNLQHLQYLIVGQHHNIKLLRDPRSSFLPEEIWDLQQLEYLHITGRNLPNPGYVDAKLPKLKALHVSAHSCTRTVYRGTPNLYKLRIDLVLQPDDTTSAESLGCLEHIGILKRLGSLKCVIVNPRLVRSQVVAPPHPLSKFPRHLKKLSLTGLSCSWEYMTEIGSLMFLEVLKLQCCDFPGPKWEIWSEQFPRVEFLLLEDIDLVEWTISEHDCFPELKRLVIRHCFKLTKIPRNIGAKDSLAEMEIVDCNPSLVASAMKMHAKRSSLQVVINSSWNL